MVTKNVKKNVTNSVTKWEEALADAQQHLERAKREVATWKGAIQICRKRMGDNAPWPGESASHG